MACPVRLPRPPRTMPAELLDHVLAEIDELAPWHELYEQSHSQAAASISGQSAKDVARMLDDIRRVGHPQIDDDAQWGKALRFAAEDLRSYFSSAALMRPGGAASPREIADWYWGETSAGALVLALLPICLVSENTGLRLVAETQLVPRAQRHRVTRN